MASKNVGRLVGGGLAVIIGLIVVFALLKGGDVETDVVVDDQGAGCVIVTKFDVDNGKKNKFVHWVIDNRCRPPGLVTVGNFRTRQSPSADNCRNATYGGATWPFQEDETQIIHRQNRNRISLKIKTDAELPGGGLTYYFDICTGDDAGRKSDPRLVIDP